MTMRITGLAALLATTVLSTSVATAAPKADQKGAEVGPSRVSVVSANSIPGKNIYSHLDKKVGEVRFLVVNTSDNDVRYALVDYSFDDTDELVPMPWQALDFSDRDRGVRSRVPMEQMKTAKTYTREEMEIVVTQDGAKNVHEFWDRTDWGKRAVKDVDKETLGERIARFDRSDVYIIVGASYLEALIGPDYRFDGSILPAEIEDRNGDRIGEVEDFVVKADSGTIAYAKAALGGFLGFNETLAAVPVPALKWNEERKAFRLDISQQELDRLTNNPVPEKVERVRWKDVKQMFTSFDLDLDDFDFPEDLDG